MLTTLHFSYLCGCLCLFVLSFITRLSAHKVALIKTLKALKAGSGGRVSKTALVNTIHISVYAFIAYFKTVPLT